MARIRNWADIEALRAKGALSAAEEQLIACCKAGKRCSLGGDRPKKLTEENTIRAELLRYLILGGSEGCSVDERGVDLKGAWITSELDLSFSTAFGQTTLVSCHFTDALKAVQAHFQKLILTNCKLPGILAEGAVISGDLFLDGTFQADGKVSLAGARIGSQLNCRGGSFSRDKPKSNDEESKRNDALFAQSLQAEALIWRGVVVKSGDIDFTAAHCGDLVDDLESWPDDGRLVLNGFTYDRISSPLTDAAKRLEWLRRGDTWDGVFFPQPYEQLAKVLGEMGYDADRRRVLVAKEWLVRGDACRRTLFGPQGERLPMPRYLVAKVGNGIRRAWAILLGGLVGFGYRPGYSAIWAAVLIGVGWIIAQQTWDSGQFAPNSDIIINSPEWQVLARDAAIANPAEVWSQKADGAAGIQQGQGLDYESFYSLAYSFDLVVPLISLGQEAAWAPSKDRGVWGYTLWWARWPLAVFGWIITALGAAAVTGIIRRE